MKKSNYNGLEVGDEAVVHYDQWSGGMELGRVVTIVALGKREESPWITAKYEEQTYGFFPKDLRALSKLHKDMK